MPAGVWSVMWCPVTYRSDKKNLMEEVQYPPVVRQAEAMAKDVLKTYERIGIEALHQAR